jgi:hypothetical protein
MKDRLIEVRALRLAQITNARCSFETARSSNSATSARLRYRFEQEGKGDE